MASGALHVCYAQMQGLEFGEEKLPKPSGRAIKSLDFFETFRMDYEYAFLETFRSDYEYEFDYDYDF